MEVDLNMNTSLSDSDELLKTSLAEGVGGGTVTDKASGTGENAFL